MDGYSLRAVDAASPGAVLSVLEEVTAGHVPTREVTSGTCTRIMTGAPLPTGADAVVMIERTELSGDKVRIDVAARPGQNILRRGASMQRGQVILPAGQAIRPIEAGVLAEVGRTSIRAVRRPRVTILATGDELVEADVFPAAGQIRNSNGPLLAALVQNAGAEAIPLGIARDNETDLRAKIEQGLAADALVLAGGVSAGILDLVPKTLAAAGVEQVFHKVNLKPGKPIWFGVSREGKLVFGLPGNPVSTLVCFGLFVRPALVRLAGHTAAAQANPRRAILAQDHQQRDDRPTYFPAVRRYESPRDTVTPLAWRGSADLRALTDANCLAFFPGGEKTYHAGSEVETYDL
jgi:molybdopterin molybdotransferase